MKRIIAVLLMALVILSQAAHAEKYPFGIEGDESIDKMACLVASSYDSISFSITDKGYSIIPADASIYGGEIFQITINPITKDEIILSVGFVRDYDDGMTDVLDQIIADVTSNYGDYNSMQSDGVFNYEIEWDDFELSTSYHDNFNAVLFAMMWFIPAE